MKIRLVQPLPFPVPGKDFPITHEVMRRLFDDGSGFGPGLGTEIDPDNREIESAIRDVIENPPYWHNPGPPPWDQRVRNFLPEASALLKELPLLPEYEIIESSTRTRRRPGAKRRTETEVGRQKWQELSEYKEKHPGVSREKIASELGMPPRTQRDYERDFGE